MMRSVGSILLALFWLGCVGDDGREVIGSYAPAEDAGTSSGNGTADGSSIETVENEGEADALSESLQDADSPDTSE